MEIGTQIRAKRLELNLTQDDLAKKLNVARSTISNWEIGRNYPDIQIIVSISELLDLPLEVLLRKDSAVVNEITKDTKIRKVQSRRIKILSVIMVVLVLAVAYFSYKEQEYKELSSPDQIESIKVKENTILIVTDMPFYRSTVGYVINNYHVNEHTLDLYLTSAIDLSMENEEEIVVDLTALEQGISVKSIKKVNFINDNGVFKSVNL